MAAISAFGVTQHSQIFSLSFRNRIQCIALYQLHNSQALLNLRRGYYKHRKIVFCQYLGDTITNEAEICHIKVLYDANFDYGNIVWIN